ncbi:glycosyltransferase [Pseudomonas sp. Au-Pse12]|uniref:glycosyltransferase n=1 Tax=Pseudomonas sp. Au-Pse12 TaxID=2906459 RepID=UPI001E37C9A3|nr:glycosyltransferase [Pseudomonas sp. Au-Pse12]MCE4055593.1 glycosyltransferase [Pseudomonas sp. Au-Pse12]
MPDRAVLFRYLLSVYRKLPLPYSLRALLSRLYRRTLRPAHTKIRSQALACSLFQPPACALQAPLPQLPDYLFWGVIDWDFRHQRPQHLAGGLSSSGRRVFYISASLEDDPRDGFSLRPLDEHGRLFEVRLFARTAPPLYYAAPQESVILQLRRSIGELLSWADSQWVISLVQHPFWAPVAGVLPASRLVYDCMDDHQGFGNNVPALLQLEHELLRDADVTLFASAWLEQYWNQRCPPVASGQRAVLRNAADFAYFSTAVQHGYQDPQGRPVIGYYGALAHWFDVELVGAIAEAFSHCTVLLIGADTARVGACLRRHANVRLTGEIPYAQLSAYLQVFAVGILPFRIEALTLATNPVKVYEYLSAGKPVVAVDLPELQEFGQQVAVAKDVPSFIQAIARALQEPASDNAARQRQEFAAQQTWEHRIKRLKALVEEDVPQPLISVIVVTHNNLAFTRDCLASLAADPLGRQLEIIVVDNASTDASVEFLQQWASDSGHSLILNPGNLGFAAANNQGLARARGEFLVLLNNDTQVTTGWAQTLRRHLQRNPQLGLIGPVTNNIGNEAKIDISYRTLKEMPGRAGQHTWRHVDQVVPCATLGFFAVMMPRSTYERVGPLDEAFGLGFFEDDDYCRRVEQAGLSCAFAEDVFIHHHLSASFNQMPDGQRQQLFNRNKALYEAKWGRPWIPHTAREPS